MERSKLVLYVLAIAILAGALGDWILRAGPWSLNLTLWVWIVVGATLGLAFYGGTAWPRGAGWLAVPALLFALGLIWRETPVLKLFNILAMLTSLSIWGLSVGSLRIPTWGITDYARGLINSAAAAVAGMAAMGRTDIEWTALPNPAALKAVRSTLVGLLIAFPLLFVFGGLLMAADVVFENMITETLDFDFANVFSHAALTALFAWITCGFLILMLRIRKPVLAEPLRIGRPGLGIVEIGVPLALLDFLFLAFVIVQLRYLFGDAALVQETVGLTYAEYARRGFFELVTVAALVLPLLLAADWVLAESTRRGRHVFRSLAGTQLLLLFVIVISAIQRMGLYVDAYGLTDDRVYASVFMAWLGVVLAWFAATVLRGRRQHFAFGTVVSGLLTILALNIMNPDALIARVNVERARAGYEFDAVYATSLSGEAVPVLVDALPDLEPQARCTTAAHILKHWSPPEERDWRTWNRGRSAAWQAVRAEESYLSRVSCPKTD